MKNILLILLIASIYSVDSNAQSSRIRSSEAVEIFYRSVDDLKSKQDFQVGFNIHNQFGRRNIVSFGGSYGRIQDELNHDRQLQELYNDLEIETLTTEAENHLHINSQRSSANFSLAFGKRLELRISKVSIGLEALLGGQYQYFFKSKVEMSYIDEPYSLVLEDESSVTLSDPTFNQQVNEYYKKYAYNHTYNAFGQVGVDFNIGNIGIFAKKIWRYNFVNAFSIEDFSNLKEQIEIGVRFIY